MDDAKQSAGLNVYGAFILVSMLCGIATCFMGGIAYNIITSFTTISDLQTVVFALMVSPPALLGIGISYFIFKTNIAQLPYRYGKLPSRDSLD